MILVRAAIGACIAVALSPVLIWIVRHTAITAPSRRHAGALLAVAAVAGGCVATWPSTSTAAGALLVVLAVPVATVDALEHRIPNRLSLPLAAGTVIAFGITAIVCSSPSQWGRALAAGAIWSGLLALSFLITGHPGPGDVKLAPSLGMTLGWLSWNAAIAGMVVPYLLAAVVGAIGLASGRLQLREGRVPMGPPMLAATIIIATIAALI